MELWTALLLGFFGSFHCVGMCGPIAMSIPRSSSSMGTLTLNAVIYNSGRILTYSIFGLIFGFLGAHITIAGLQGSLSIILGVIIVAGVIINRYFKGYIPTSFNRLTSLITRYYGKLIRKESYPAASELLKRNRNS